MSKFMYMFLAAALSLTAFTACTSSPKVADSSSTSDIPSDMDSSASADSSMDMATTEATPEPMAEPMNDSMNDSMPESTPEPSEMAQMDTSAPAAPVESLGASSSGLGH